MNIRGQNSHECVAFTNILSSLITFSDCYNKEAVELLSVSLNYPCNPADHMQTYYDHP